MKRFDNLARRLETAARDVRLLGKDVLTDDLAEMTKARDKAKEEASDRYRWYNTAQDTIKARDDSIVRLNVKLNAANATIARLVGEAKQC